MQDFEEKVARQRAKRLARVEERADRIAAWWPYLYERYEGLISRGQETSSEAGWDGAPATRPCEHRLEWRSGRLCMACDNTGWRKLTKKEREEGLGVDPYSAQVSKGITIVKDESPSARRARHAERNDAILAGLVRDQRVREGKEALEDPSMRQYRVVVRKPYTVQRILRAIELLRVSDPIAYELLPRRRGLVALAELMYRTEKRQRQIPEPS